MHIYAYICVYVYITRLEARLKHKHHITCNDKMFIRSTNKIIYIKSHRQIFLLWNVSGTLPPNNIKRN